MRTEIPSRSEQVRQSRGPERPRRNIQYIQYIQYNQYIQYIGRIQTEPEGVARLKPDFTSSPTLGLTWLHAELKGEVGKWGGGC